MEFSSSSIKLKRKRKNNVCLLQRVVIAELHRDTKYLQKKPASLQIVRIIEYAIVYNLSPLRSFTQPPKFGTFHIVSVVSMLSANQMENKHENSNVKSTLFLYARIPTFMYSFWVVKPQTHIAWLTLCKYTQAHMHTRI